MDALNDYQFVLLSLASKEIKETDMGPYFRMRELLRVKPQGFEAEFTSAFIHHYRMNAGGLTDEFKRKFFQLLFTIDAKAANDPYTDPLKALYEFPRRKNDYALQCSFVSKMVAIHDDSRPIYDKHVSKFFGIGVPGIGSIEFKIASFISNLNNIRSMYQAWSHDPRFKHLREELCQHIPDLGGSHPVRICDALVWTVGRKKLA